MNILYKLATRSRPNRCKETIDSILKNATTEDFKILLSCDYDDVSMANYSLNEEERKFIHICYGYSKNKIDAINRDIEDFNYDWHILVNVSDDMIIENGFDRVLLGAFNDSLDKFLHLPDGYANERLATMSIMGRDYYNRFGYIYHPSYESVYCDNEAMDVSKIMNKYVYINAHVFKHIHPANVGSHLLDAQYKKTEASDVHARDCKNYQNRKANNFA